LQPPSGLLSGSAGGITALVNIAPKVHVKLLKHFQNGELEEAWRIQRLIGHGEWAGSKLGAIAGVKAIVAREFQYGSSRVRAPLKSKEIPSSVGLEQLQEVIQLERSL
jgi:4-hydroxy-2-oxoglutarate aldolase